jgi:acyl dehydratase
MRAASEVKEELTREYTGRYGLARTEPVESGRVRDYLLALDEPADPAAVAPGRPVPPLFLLTLGRTRRPMPSSGGAVNAGDVYEFFAPVHVGDSITVERRVVGVEERQGRNGRVFLIHAEATYTNQQGRLVGRALLDTMRMGI